MRSPCLMPITTLAACRTPGPPFPGPCNTITPEPGSCHNSICPPASAVDKQEAGTVLPSCSVMVVYLGWGFPQPIARSIFSSGALPGRNGGCDTALRMLGGGKEGRSERDSAARVNLRRTNYLSALGRLQQELCLNASARQWGEPMHD